MVLFCGFMVQGWDYFENHRGHRGTQRWRHGVLSGGGGLQGGVFRNTCQRYRIHMVYGCETVRSVGYLCLFAVIFLFLDADLNLKV